MGGASTNFTTTENSVQRLTWFSEIFIGGTWYGLGSQLNRTLRSLVIS
jgi:hypothetical protein